MANRSKKTSVRQARITDYINIPQARPMHFSTGKKTMNINCYQVNNQKRIISCERINKYCEENNLFLCLGQEPSTHSGRITGLNSFHTLVHAAVQRPRAYIYAHKSLRIWPMDTLNSQDTAVAMIDTGIQNIGKIIVCSVYWDGRIDTFPELAIAAIEKANNDGHTILIGGDVNARSRIYGSTETDARGNILERLFLS